MNENYQKSRKGNNVCDCKITCDIVPENDSTEAAECDAAVEARDTRERRREDFCEPVCVDTNQIYDSCRDRDCVLNARVYTTADNQALLDNATNIKLKKAEIIWVYSNIEPLSFNNGYYSIDLKFYVCVTLEVFSGLCSPTTVRGLTMYDKRVILYGSEGNSKVFKSNSNLGMSCDLSSTWQNTCLPTVVVETVEPVSLSAKIVDPCPCSTDIPCTTTACDDCLFPSNICDCFDGELLVSDNLRHVRVSYGLFSIVRLERDSQLLLDAVDFCIPTKECPSATEENPCNLFNDIRFPINEFFPPQKRSDDKNCPCKDKC